MKLVSIISVLALAFFSTTGAQQGQHPNAGPGDGTAIYRPDQIKWQDGPASLPHGAKFAILEGDPAKEGFFTIRIWMPDGFKVPPHSHPKVEHVTVISGIINRGVGDKFDQAATQAMPAGTFAFWPAGIKHFAWSKGETVLQLHGIGPWEVEYVNPSDDPRKSNESSSKP